MSTIGSRIRNRREQLGLSQDELGKRLGYKSRSSINKIELDQRNLTQSKIKAIADALETTPEYIMGWKDTDQETNLETLKSEVSDLTSTLESVKNHYGQSVADILELVLFLDETDQAEIRGYINALLRKDKYSIKDGCKNA